MDKCLHLLDGNEIKVLLYVIRRIIGFNKNFDFISLGQLENGIVTQSGERLDSGTGLSKPSIIKALSGLKKYGILLEVQKSQSPKLGSAYTLQFNYDKIDLTNLEKRELDKGRNTSKKDLLVKDIYQSKPFTSKKDLLVDQPKNSQKSVDLLVNGFDTQNSDKNKKKKEEEEEKEIGISHSLNACSFDSASTFLGSDKVEEFSTNKATLKSETQKPENPNNPKNPKKDEQQVQTIQPKSEPSKPAKQKNLPDPRSKHPAIVAVREIIGRFPDKLIWDEIIQAVGESPDLEQLKFCAREWAKKTTNMGNLSTWLFDWYVNGLPVSTYQGQVLNQTQNQAQIQVQSQNARTELAVNSPTQLVQSRQFQQPIIHNKAIQTQNFNDAVFDTIRKQMKG